MATIREGQDTFREDLVSEHYRVFQGHRIFCHATLKGFWNWKVQPAQKVTAHHINAYSPNRFEPWVHYINNGILLAPPFHNLLHETQEASNPRQSVAEVSRAMITDSFNRNWRRASTIYLPDGSNFADVWEAHLVSKCLLPVPTPDVPVQLVMLDQL